MKTAVIIVNYNSENDTIKYVKEIEKYNCINTIIVVDNFSKYGEVLFSLKSDKVHVIRAEKNGGYSYGNNLALKFLEGLNQTYDYIVISNPDVEVPEISFKACFEELNQNKKTGICSPRMYDKNDKPIRRSSWKIRTPAIDIANSTRVTEILLYKLFKSGEYSKEEFTKNPRLKVEAITGAFFVIRYNLFKQCGYFDDNVFLFYEEDILAKKIQKLGFEAYSLNNVSFKHYESSTIDKALSYWKKVKRLQESKMYFQKKYNNINKFQICIFSILNFWRKIELLVEIPVRKILRK